MLVYNVTDFMYRISRTWTHRQSTGGYSDCDLTNRYAQQKLFNPDTGNPEVLMSGQKSHVDGISIMLILTSEAEICILDPKVHIRGQPQLSY